jgi:hypothetical protein
MMAALTTWAIAATVCAAIDWTRAAAAMRDYRAALALFRSLGQPAGKTPHQRAAETARANRLAASQAHRAALRSSMGTTNGG